MQIMGCNGHIFLLKASISEGIEINESKSVCSRCYLLSLIKNHFWKKWRKEYRSQLLRQARWLKPNYSKVGDRLILKDDLLPATKWPLTRIAQLHPGRVGLTRVVSLKTPTSTFKRPVNRLIFFPRNKEATAHLRLLRESMAGGRDHV